MESLLSYSGTLISMLLWVLLWGLGGNWTVRSAFNLEKEEEFLAGLGAGLVLQTFFVNLLGQIISAEIAFWVAPAVVLLLGIGLSLPLSKENIRDLFKFEISIPKMVLLLALIYIFTVVGRGLAILDDYQNLPTTSLIAAGYIPPRFALDPNVRFDYHYFTLMFAGQIMRLFDLHAWNSLDFARAIGFSIGLLLGAMWIKRVTRSVWAAFLAAMMAMFSGGTRWLLLLLPVKLLKNISANISMIGSGAASGENFFAALSSPLGIDGAGVYPMPFAFFNGISTYKVWYVNSGGGALGGVLGSLLLLSHNRWKGWRGGLVVWALLTARTLSSETSIITLALGMGLIAVIYCIQHRTFKLPKSLLRWFAVIIPAGIVSGFQGGVLSGIVLGWLARLSGAAEASYFSFGFALRWPPAFLSSHLGLLSSGNIYQVIAAIFEIGPVLLMLPLVVIWGRKAYRTGRWYEAAIIIVPFVYLITMFVEYTGNAGPTALNRIQGQIIGISKGSFAIATLWYWVKNRADWVKVTTGILLLVTMLGGIVIFALEMISAPHPVYATFLDTLDARMEEKYWNELEEDAVIFDPNASRPATILGRVTDAGITWYEFKPEWEALVKDPDVYELRSAGFDYVYVGFSEWDKREQAYQSMLENPCVELVDEIEVEGPPYDFRRLMDIRNCEAASGN